MNSVVKCDGKVINRRSRHVLHERPFHELLVFRKCFSIVSSMTSVIRLPGPDGNVREKTRGPRDDWKDRLDPTFDFVGSTVSPEPIAGPRPPRRRD